MTCFWPIVGSYYPCKTESKADGTIEAVAGLIVSQMTFSPLCLVS